jgi:heme A synthase
MKGFRRLALATAVVVYLQVVLGSVVRITGSGLACRDWPLCNGSLVPAFDANVLIEWSHRLVGSAAGVLMVATAVYAVLLYRGRAALPRGLMFAAIGGVLLIGVQGVVGGITVLLKNSPFTVALHLGNALLVLGATVVVAAWAYRAGLGASARTSPSPRNNAVMLNATYVAFLVVVSGAWVVGTGASGACTGWPWPSCGTGGELAAYHLGHRVLVLGATIVILIAVREALRRWRGTRMAFAAYAVAGLLLAEILVGGTQVLLDLPAVLRSLHVALAGAVWAGTVLLAAAAWLETHPARTLRAVTQPNLASARS